MRLALDSGRLLDGMSDHVARGMTVQRQNPAYRHTVMHLHRFSQTHGLALFRFVSKIFSNPFKHSLAVSNIWVFTGRLLGNVKMLVIGIF